MVVAILVCERAGDSGERLSDEKEKLGMEVMRRKCQGLVLAEKNRKI